MTAKKTRFAKRMVAPLYLLLSFALSACSGDDTQTVDGGTTRDSGGDCVLDFTAASSTFMLISEPAGSGSSVGGLQGQGLFVANMITRGCGIDGTRILGVPTESINRDSQNNPSIAADFVRQASRDGQLFVVGAGGDAPTTVAAQIAVDRQFPMGVFGSSNDELRGCSQAEIADVAVRKVATPTASEGACWNSESLVFRTAVSNREWSETTVAFALDRDPTLSRAALLVQNAGGGNTFASAATSSFIGSGAGRTASVVTYPASPSDAAIRTALRTALETDPEVLLTQLDATELRQALQAFEALRQDSTFIRPANFTSFLWLNGGLGRISATDLRSDTLEDLRDRFFGLIPTWESTSVGFRRWSEAYRAFDPDAEIINPLQPRIFDALMILALAAVAADTSDGPAIASQIRSVSNPPGEVVYADDFATARSLLLRGEEVNYEGASGPVDIDDTGGVTDGPYQIWSLTLTGRDFTVALFNSGT